MYVCLYIVRYDCICMYVRMYVCMYVGEHVCRPSPLCDPVNEKIDNNIKNKFILC